MRKQLKLFTVIALMISLVTVNTTSLFAKNNDEVTITVIFEGEGDYEAIQLAPKQKVKVDKNSFVDIVKLVPPLVFEGYTLDKIWADTKFLATEDTLFFYDYSQVRDETIPFTYLMLGEDSFEVEHSYTTVTGESTDSINDINGVLNAEFLEDEYPGYKHCITYNESVDIRNYTLYNSSPIVVFSNQDCNVKHPVVLETIRYVDFEKDKVLDEFKSFKIIGNGEGRYVSGYEDYLLSYESYYTVPDHDYTKDIKILKNTVKSDVFNDIYSTIKSEVNGNRVVLNEEYSTVSIFKDNLVTAEDKANVLSNVISSIKAIEPFDMYYGDDYIQRDDFEGLLYRMLSKTNVSQTESESISFGLVSSPKSEEFYNYTKLNLLLIGVNPEASIEDEFNDDVRDSIDQSLKDYAVDFDIEKLLISVNNEEPLNNEGKTKFILDFIKGLNNTKKISLGNLFPISIDEEEALTLYIEQYFNTPTARAISVNDEVLISLYDDFEQKVTYTIAFNDVVEDNSKPNDDVIVDEDEKEIPVDKEESEKPIDKEVPTDKEEVKKPVNENDVDTGVSSSSILYLNVLVIGLIVLVKTKRKKYN